VVDRRRSPSPPKPLLEPKDGVPLEMQVPVSVGLEPSRLVNNDVVNRKNVQQSIHSLRNTDLRCLSMHVQNAYYLYLLNDIVV